MSSINTPGSTTAPDWTRDELQARIEKPPFNTWLGLRMIDWDADGITIGVCARPETYGSSTRKALHGGILAALVDIGCAMSVIARTGESVFTVDMRIDYLRPALAEEYKVRGEIVRLGRTLATADARLFAADGRLVASGRAVMQHAPNIASEDELPRA
jgi:uncharacterized protein (TIGR00369 family)